MWRLIPLEAHNAYINMAMDEALMASVAAGGQPTIRFYKWKPSAVTVGYSQKIRDEVNLNACKGLGIDYTRRVTGGGAIFHDGNGELTYSVVAPESLFSQDLMQSYLEICSAIVKALGAVGIRAEIANTNDILVNGKKISGNAQVRANGVLLQHGTIIHSFDSDLNFKLLNLNGAAKDVVTSVLKNRKVPEDEVYQELVKAFSVGKEIIEGKLSSAEWKLTRKLAEKYASADWLFGMNGIKRGACYFQPGNV